MKSIIWLNRNGACEPTSIVSLLGIASLNSSKRQITRFFRCEARTLERVTQENVENRFEKLSCDLHYTYSGTRKYSNAYTYKFQLIK